MHFLAKSLFALGFLAAAMPALAQQEPPARVGRVAVVAGELGFHGPGETNWSKASPNYPVASGESFWTDPKSRAADEPGEAVLRLPWKRQITLP